MIGNKGASETAIDWFVAMIFTVMVVIILLIITSAYKTNTIDTTGIEPDVYVSKLYYSQQILAPDGDVLYFGVIDEDAFTTERLDAQNEYEDATIGARLTLLESDESTAKGPIYNNEQFFNETYPFAANNIPGRGGAALREYIYPVQIRSGADERPGYLFIEVVVSR